MTKLNLQKTINIVFYLLLGMALSFSNLQANNSCQYRAFTIKVLDNVTTQDLIDQLSMKCGFSVIVKDKVAKRKMAEKLNGININNMSLSEIFNILLKDNNLEYSFKDNLLKISGVITKTFEIDYITSVRSGTAVLNASVQSSNSDTGSNAPSDENSITSSETFNFWKGISKDILSIANSGSESYIVKKPIINQNAGLITVTGTKEQLDRIAKYLQDVKSRLDKEVLIDVSIISVDLSKSHSSGIDWSKFAIGINNPQGDNVPVLDGATSGLNTANLVAKGDKIYHLGWNNAFNFSNTISFTMDGLMNFLKTQGNSKIVSNPKILTLNNQQALITIGDNVNYRVPETSPANTGGTITTTSYTNESIFVGILLNIMPEISNNNEIILRINPSISSFKYASDDKKQITPREIAPDTSEKKLSTVIRIKNNDTIILGGLISKSNNNANNGILGLKDLPILGNIFKSQSTSSDSRELIFVITPKIVNPNKNNHKNISLKALGYGSEIGVK